MQRVVPLLVLTLTPHLLAAQKAADSTPPAAAWNQRAIVWPAADTDGTKFAFLEGRNDVRGRTFSREVRVFVMSGALRVSYGEKLDSASARTYPAGAFLYVPARNQGGRMACRIVFRPVAWRSEAAAEPLLAAGG